MAHRGGLSPAFVAMMLNKNLKKPRADSVSARSAPSESGFTPLEEILRDRSEQQDRLGAVDKPQTGGPSVANTRSEPVKIAANSVTVPLPIYAVPPGYQPSGDGTNMYLRDRGGNLVKNPLLQKRIDNFKFNKCGIAADLGGLAGESAAGGLGPAGAAVGGVVAAGSNTIKGLCS